MADHIENTMRALFGLLVSLVWFASLAEARQVTNTIRGSVVDHSTNQPLAGASISLLPLGSGLGASTDDEGKFEIKQVPVGRQSIQISFTGYETNVVRELLVVSGKEVVVELQLESAPYQLEEVEVSAEVPQIEEMDKVDINAEQFQRIAANYLDPARVVMSSPSVANTNDQNNAVSVRGNSPIANTWRLEGVEIVNPNHLANAGTISDRPTQNGGGVNVLSTQMLDKSSFLMGYMPAGYGNALGGIFDMNLRKGNNQQREYTAQASLIGLDFAAEGPFKKGGSASYLVNYRYSFTGVLALMGVDFGGETIKFQDLSFNVSLPKTPIGEVTLFGVNGWNSNVFKGPDDKNDWTEDKDLSDIDYASSIYAYGVTQEATIGSRSNWKNVVVYSSTTTERDQNSRSLNSPSFTSTTQDNEQVSKLSFASIVSTRLGNNITSKAGIRGTAYQWGNDRTESLFFNNNSAGAGAPDFNLAINGLLLQPFISGNFALGSRVDLDLGLNSSWFDYTNEFLLEPRANLELRLAPKTSLSFRSGIYSQVLSPYAYYTANSFPASGQAIAPSDRGNTGLQYTKSWSSEIAWTQKIGTSSTLGATAFYQSLYDLPFAYNGFYDYFNYMNFDGTYPLEALATGGKGRVYGISLEHRQQIVNGFYIWSGGSLYRSEYEDLFGQYRASSFDGRYSLNATLGKEWMKTKKNGIERLFGVNSRVLYQGGFLQQEPGNVEGIFGANRLGDYFRLDLRVQWTRFKKGYTQMFAIDVQNLLNVENPAYYYFDTVQNKQVLKTQLGLIPVLVYRIDF